MAERRVEVELFGFQEDFVGLGIDTPISWLFLYVHSGRGSGKTVAGAMRMMSYMAKFPGSMGFITVPKYDTWTDSTYPAIREVFKWAGWQAGTDWTYIENKKMFVFKPTNCIAFVRSTDEPESLAGPTLAWTWMDEARLSSEEAFRTIVPALRQPNMPYQVWITTTPAGRNHWLFKYWFPDDYYRENPDAQETNLDMGGITPIFREFAGKTSDNPYGGKAGDAMARKLYGYGTPMYRQEALGEHVFSQGIVYELWDRQKHMKPLDLWPSSISNMNLACGVDFGWDAPTAFIVGGVDSEKRRYLIEEVYKRHLDNDAIANEAVKIALKYPYLRYFGCDSSAPEKILAINTAFRNKGILAKAIKSSRRIGAVDDITSGIGRFSTSLSFVDKDGNQGFFANPNMLNFQREIENYVKQEVSDFQNPKEKPRPYADHLLDAVRYLESVYYRMGWLGEPKPAFKTFDVVMRK